MVHKVSAEASDQKTLGLARLKAAVKLQKKVDEITHEKIRRWKKLPALRLFNIILVFTAVDTDV